jgi:predicted GH43/DUF377 family glycosyl hydrolase
VSHSGLRRTHPLGVFRDNESVALIGREKYGATWRLVLGHGQEQNFHLQHANPSLVLPLGRKEHLADVDGIRISHILDRRIMTYTAEHDGHHQLRVALFDPSDDMELWDVFAADRRLTGQGMIVSEYLHEGQYVLFYGEKSIQVAFSKNLSAWHTGSAPVASPRSDHFDSRDIRLLSVSYIQQGLFIVYESNTSKAGKIVHHIGAVLCSANEPDRVIWRSDEPLYTHTSKAKEGLRCLGAVVYESHLTLYLGSNREKLITVNLPHPFGAQTIAPADLKLHRFARNPVLSPGIYEWESRAVFNPAAFVDNGRVHLLYRAMGPDGVSRIGYASSADGVHFDERLDYPVYTPSYGFGLPAPNADLTHKRYDPTLFPSGGGWAGCEDPRAVTIDGRVYMSFMAFNGWDFMRQALTSISLDHFKRKRWRWRDPVLISKPGSPQKNWVIFPEKINGKFAILHGLSPKIHIDYVDSLDDFDGSTYIESLPPAHGAGYHDPQRKAHWDTRVRGAGAPPLKTPLGWLLLYHANDQHDPGKYKLGAMILDLDDPTKVLYRANAPILQPDEWYENDGKPGVIYTCGAVIINNNLVVYYGGGDKHIAVARANVHAFIDALVANHSIQLTPVAMSEMSVS